MDTLLRGNADEINVSLVEFIRSTFKGKKVAVHIYEDNEMDETEYLLSDPVGRERLLKSVEEVKQGKGLKEYTFDELKTTFLNEPETQPL
jgi:PHD/YefM family antitoxin component YafN of YafNO toxin-antitoxin module